MATITIYRLEGVDLESDTLVSDAFSPDHFVEEVRLKPGLDARLFLTRTGTHQPEWAVYLEQITTEPLPIDPRESTGAVLLIRPETSKKTIFAATWGTGHFLLRADKVQADVGLRVALNLLVASTKKSKTWDPARVRAIRTKRVGQTTLISQTQASRKISIDVFPFSV